MIVGNIHVVLFVVVRGGLTTNGIILIVGFRDYNLPSIKLNSQRNQIRKNWIKPDRSGKLNKLYIVLLAIISVYITTLYAPYQQDDGFIYYSYAQNIAHGNGYCFNPGDHINATTSPLYTLLLAGSHKITGVELPTIGVIVTGVGLFLMALFLFLLLPSPNKYFAPIIMMLFPTLYNAVGMEVTLAFASGLATIYCYLQCKHNTAALLAAISILLRPDLAALVAVLLIHNLIVNKKTPTLKMTIIFIATLLPWLIFSYLYFGSIVPDSITAKIDKGISSALDPSPWGFISALVEYSIYRSVALKNVIVALLSIFSLVYVVGIKKMSQQSHIIVAWILLYTFVYGFILHTLAFSWYYCIYSILFPVIICDVCFNFKTKFKAGVYISCTFVAIILFSFVLKKNKNGVEWKPSAYKSFAYAIEPNKRLACAEIGCLRYYYKDGEIVDLYGLATKGVRVLFSTGDHKAIYNLTDPDYVILYQKPPQIPPSGSDAVQTEAWFKERYQKNMILQVGWRTIVLYKKR